MACRCSRSLAIVCALFSSLAVAGFLAEDRCRDAGGRVSDVAWVCELAGGVLHPLWAGLSLSRVTLVFLAVGVPVYLVVDALGRRWIGGRGKPRA